MDIWAPGYAILSSYIDNQAANMSGTSMSAPHVTAVMALIGEASPEANFTIEKEAIIESSTLITNEDNNVTKPRVDAKAAVSYVTDLDQLKRKKGKK